MLHAPFFILWAARSPSRLRWADVEEGDAQLLPAPGAVAPERSMTDLLASPSRATIMLQVTNEAGQQVMRSVEIEVVESTPSTQSQPQCDLLSFA